MNLSLRKKYFHPPVIVDLLECSWDTRQVGKVLRELLPELLGHGPRVEEDGLTAVHLVVVPAGERSCSGRGQGAGGKIKTQHR